MKRYQCHHRTKKWKPNTFEENLKELLPSNFSTYLFYLTVNEWPNGNLHQSFKINSYFTSYSVDTTRQRRWEGASLQLCLELVPCFLRCPLAPCPFQRGTCLVYCSGSKLKQKISTMQLVRGFLREIFLDHRFLNVPINKIK